jgi:hypothetical protein
MPDQSQSLPGIHGGILRGAAAIAQYVSSRWEPKTEQGVYYDVKAKRLLVARNGKHLTSSPESIDAQYIAFRSPPVA